MMQIFNEKYKTLLINNKEDEVTKITITTIKYDADKSPRRFPSRHLRSVSIWRTVVRSYYNKVRNVNKLNCDWKIT